MPDFQIISIRLLVEYLFEPSETTYLAKHTFWDLNHSVFICCSRLNGFQLQQK